MRTNGDLMQLRVAIREHLCASLEDRGARERKLLTTRVETGWNTYAIGLPYLPSPYRHLRQIVFTRGHKAPADADGVEFTDRDPVKYVRELKSESGKGIWLCGGGPLAFALRNEIDRLALKRNPLLLGSGIPLFASGDYAPTSFRPAAVTPLESGVILEEYERA